MANSKPASSTTSYTRRCVLSGVAIGTGGWVAASATGGVVSYALPWSQAESTDVPRAVALGAAALAAPKLTRTSLASTYPPVINFDRPVEWIEGDQVVMQRSIDATFQIRVSEAAHIMYAAMTSYDFQLSTVTSGSWFFRMAAWRGDRPADDALNWSNIVNVGDVVAPTITTNATQSTMSIPLAANEAATWEIVGGAQATLWEINGAILSPLGGAVSVDAHEIIVRATDYAGLSADRTITNTLDATPNSVSFTSATGAAPNTPTESDEITIAGLGTGVVARVTVSGGGEYAKKPSGGSYGVWTSSPGTAVNGDAFKRRVTSGSSATTTKAPLKVGPLTIPFSVATTGAAWADEIGINKRSAITVSGVPKLLASNVANGETNGVRALPAALNNLSQFELALTAHPGAHMYLGVTDAATLNLANLIPEPWHLSRTATLVVESWGGSGTSKLHAPDGGVAVEVSGFNYGTWKFGGENPDVLTVRIDKTAKTVRMWRNKWNGSAYVATEITTAALGLPSNASFHAYFAAYEGGAQVTANFTGPFVLPLSGGYSAYA